MTPVLEVRAATCSAFVRFGYLISGLANHGLLIDIVDLDRAHSISPADAPWVAVQKGEPLIA
jgi:hypothetical protein